MAWAFGFIARNGFVRARRFYHSRICLKTAAKVSLTRTNSADGSTPNFRATQDFSMVANFSTRKARPVALLRVLRLTREQ